jgi:AIPR protein
MTGISDQSLFAYNVRGPLGRTQVNRDIVSSITNKGRHKEFPLFHNGITVIARDVNNNSDALTVSGYYVVNGCQSLTALFDIKNWRPPITAPFRRKEPGIRRDGRLETSRRFRAEQASVFGFGSDRLSVAIGFAAGVVSAADCAGQTAAVRSVSQTIRCML